MARHLRNTISMCYPKFSDLKVPTKQFYYIAWNLPTSIHHLPESNFLSFDLRFPLAVHEPVDLGDSLASAPKKH